MVASTHVQFETCWRVFLPTYV